MGAQRILAFPRENCSRRSVTPAHQDPPASQRPATKDRRRQNLLRTHGQWTNGLRFGKVSFGTACSCKLKQLLEVLPALGGEVHRRMLRGHELNFWRRCGPIVLIGLSFCLSLHAQPPSPAKPVRESGVSETKPDPAAVEYFEKSVRPILAARCQGCHGPSKQKGGLRLDARAAILTGGSTGPAVVPGNLKESLLVDAINYGETFQMPPKSKLPAAEIATLTEWVKKGAPWGFETTIDTANKANAKPSATSDQLSKVEYAKRARFWSFQPIKRNAARREVRLS